MVGNDKTRRKKWETWDQKKYGLAVIHYKEHDGEVGALICSHKSKKHKLQLWFIKRVNSY